MFLRLKKIRCGKNVLSGFVRTIIKIFIPHASNNHWPHALRPKIIVTYGTGLLIIKLTVMLILFITFPNQAYFSKEQIEKIFELTNEDRQRAKLPILSLEPYLSEVAETRAHDMAEKKYFSHYTPEGYAPWYFLDNSIYDYAYAGENLAMNFTEMESVERGFMASPSHRENILNPHFSDVGFAVKTATIGGKKTQVLVTIFAAKRKASFSLLQQELLNNSVATELLQLQPPPPTLTVAGTKMEVSGSNYYFPKELLVFPSREDSETLAVKLYRYSHFVFLGFLVFFVSSLFINILIKIRVQHHALLLKSALLVGFIFLLVATKVHFLEGMPLRINIY